MYRKIITIFLLLLLIIIIIYYVKYEKEYFISNNTSPKKIAFCFLIYDKINNEKLWYDYIKGIDKVNITYTYIIKKM